jgi:LPXTG-site transpeptidase (sortase) family protein
MPPKPESKRRHSWKRWLANLLILAGVLLLAYPISTWGYTWFAQRDLRHQLAQADSQITAPMSAFAKGDYTPVAPGAATVGDTASTTISTIGSTGPDASTATTGPAAGTNPSATGADAERAAQLGAFKAAADAFALSVGSQVGKPIGRIVIPSIGLDVVMVEGTGKGDLREGPGHWPETPFPGQGGNFVVSGHRTTYGAPFLKINKVKVGDEIDLVLPYAVARYTVTRVVIVLPTEVEEVAQRGREQVSLAACHPIYSASHRIVVQGDLTGFKLTGPQG